MLIAAPAPRSPNIGYKIASPAKSAINDAIVAQDWIPRSVSAVEIRQYQLGNAADSDPWKKNPYYRHGCKKS